VPWASLRVLTRQWTKICISCLAILRTGDLAEPCRSPFVALPPPSGLNLIKTTWTYRASVGAINSSIFGMALSWWIHVQPVRLEFRASMRFHNSGTWEYIGILRWPPSYRVYFINNTNKQQQPPFLIFLCLFPAFPLSSQHRIDFLSCLPTTTTSLPPA
jgi:hypothetical protein